MGDAANQSLLTANHGYEVGDAHAHLKPPPTSRARTPLAHGREGQGWKNEAALLPLRRQCGNLEGLKTGKRQSSMRQSLKYLHALDWQKKVEATNSWRTAHAPNRAL